MRQLTDVVTDYVRQKRAAGTQWYTWSFRPDRMPPDVLDSRGLPGSWYDRNAILKHRLHDAWLTGPGRRAELESYYIRDWGGVRGNRIETLETYHRAGAEETSHEVKQESPAGPKLCACATRCSMRSSMRGSRRA